MLMLDYPRTCIDADTMNTHILLTTFEIRERKTARDRKSSTIAGMDPSEVSVDRSLGSRLFDSIPVLSSSVTLLQLISLRCAWTHTF